MKQVCISRFLMALLICILPAISWAQVSAGFRLEADTITLTPGSFQTITFKQSYTDPVIFLLTDVSNPDPSSVRVRNVTSTSAQIVQVEPSTVTTDLTDQPATVQYLVIEKGQHTFPDGTRAEVGTVNTTAIQHGSGVTGTETWATQAYSSAFGSAPALIAEIQTMNNELGHLPGSNASPWFETEIRNVGASDFELALGRSEVPEPNPFMPVAEEVAYLAIQAGTINDYIDNNGVTVSSEARITADNIAGHTACNVNNFAQSYAAPPLVIGNKVRHDGGDGGWLRRCSTSGTAVTLEIDEDQSSNTERAHTTEQAALIVFSEPFVIDFDLFPNEPPPLPVSDLRLEAGTLTLAPGSFQTIAFEQGYIDPAVFVLGDFSNPDPSSVRVRNITGTSAELVQVEADSLLPNQPNQSSTVQYLVVEKGQHNFPDGTRLEVGTVDVTALQLGPGVAGTQSLATQPYNTSFSAVPALLAQIQTMNNEPGHSPGNVSAPWLTTAIVNVQANNFQVALDRAEVNDPSSFSPVAEQVAYLAIEAGAISDYIDNNGVVVSSEALNTADNITGDCVASNFAQSYAGPPLVVGNMVRRDGNNGGWLRRCSTSNTAVSLEVDEDQSNDTERIHTGEQAGLMVFSEPFVADFGLRPVADWHFDEPSWDGTTGEVIDSSSNGFNGTTFNGTQTGSTTPALAGDPGTCGYGVFDGANDFIEIPHDDILNGTTELTYTAWINPDTWGGGNRQIIAKSVHGGGSGRAQMGIFSEGGVLLGRVETTGGRFNTSVALPALNTWSHIALVFDGDSLTLYVDGVPGVPTNFASTTLNQTTDPINISKRVGSNQFFFDGLIDEVGVYKHSIK